MLIFAHISATSPAQKIDLLEGCETCDHPISCTQSLPFSLASSEMLVQLLSVLLHSLEVFLLYLLQQLSIPALIISSYQFSFVS
jgi:hypothetical protein